MSEENRLFKRKRFTGKAFTLKVGADLGNVEEFVVHEVVLKETSGFFQAAVKKEWKEGAERVINMPEDKPEVVSAYVDWLYTDKVFPMTGEPPKTAHEHGDHTMHLVKLYIFGEKTQDDMFCDAVITAWTKHIGAPIEGTRYYFWSGAIELLFAGTPSGSPARKLVVYVTAKHGNKDWLQKFKDFTKPALAEFVWELSFELMKDDYLRPAHNDELFDQRKQWFKKK